MQEFKYTVHCFDDKKLRKHFTNKREAIVYANQLLAAGHKIKLFDYTQPKRYIDYLAEQEQPR